MITPMKAGSHFPGSQVPNLNDPQALRKSPSIQKVRQLHGFLVGEPSTDQRFTAFDGLCDRWSRNNNAIKRDSKPLTNIRPRKPSESISTTGTKGDNHCWLVQGVLRCSCTSDIVLPLGGCVHQQCLRPRRDNSESRRQGGATLDDRRRHVESSRRVRQDSRNKD
jgi:hypothetical protein